MPTLRRRLRRCATAVVIASRSRRSSRACVRGSAGSVLAASPFPVGVDGYFYPIQLRVAARARRRCSIRRSPLTFWLMAPFAALDRSDHRREARRGARRRADRGAGVRRRRAARRARRGAGLRRGGARGDAARARRTCRSSSSSTASASPSRSPRCGSCCARSSAPIRRRARIGGARVRSARRSRRVLATTSWRRRSSSSIAVPAVDRGRAARRAARPPADLRAALGVAARADRARRARPRRAAAVPVARTISRCSRAVHGAPPQWGAPALVDAARRRARVRPRGAARRRCVAIAAVVVLIAATRTSRARPSAARATVAAGVIVVLALAIALPWLAVDDPQGLGVPPAGRRVRAARAVRRDRAPAARAPARAARAACAIARRRSRSLLCAVEVAARSHRGRVAHAPRARRRA